MAGANLLIGSGETLTSNLVRPDPGPNNKAYPYSIEDARQALAPQIKSTVNALRSLDASAKPRGEGVALVTVHPAFLSKWLLPHKVFKRAKLRSLGSKGTFIDPRQDARVNVKPGAKLAADLYLAGTEKAFEDLLDLLMSDDSAAVWKKEFCSIEAIRAQDANDRILRIDGQAGTVPIELVVHGDGADQQLLDALEFYAQRCGTKLELNKRYSVPQLIFVPGVAPIGQIKELAKFAPIRAIRRLPSLRLHRPIVKRSASSPAPPMPSEPALNENVSVVAFDGGLGVLDFAPWATETVWPSLQSTSADYLAHGSEVTSSLLFGALNDSPDSLPRPYFRVRHERVLGAIDEADVDLYDCMQRINTVLAKGDVSFCNLSLGPNLYIDDAQPHAWTCMLDQHLSKGTCLATVAVGNDGALDGELGRIQPPADAVNALAVGSASSQSFLWQRANYSCRGPGRSPGLVKPDGLAFGGSAGEEVQILSPYSRGVTGVQGTSFAAPLALRVAAGAAAVAETKLSATALRALMIHKCEPSVGNERVDVGWGRFPATVEELLQTDDNTATVLYQGDLSAQYLMRAKIPIPAVPMGTRLSITATFCFATTVDPADTLNYTRHGLTIVFRPRGEGSTESFFSSHSYGSEDDLRRDAHKWETVLHNNGSWRAEELVDACFDIQHGARLNGKGVSLKDIPKLPYVLVVTITSNTREPIYQSVLQRYTTLVPIRVRSRLRT